LSKQEAKQPQAEWVSQSVVQSPCETDTHCAHKLNLAAFSVDLPILETFDVERKAATLRETMVSVQIQLPSSRRWMGALTLRGVMQCEIQIQFAIKKPQSISVFGVSTMC
jgi:hypothetical protein